MYGLDYTALRLCPSQGKTEFEERFAMLHFALGVLHQLRGRGKTERDADLRKHETGRHGRANDDSA